MIFFKTSKQNTISWCENIQNLNFSVPNFFFLFLIQLRLLDYNFIYGCFCTVTAELSSCDKDIWPAKPKMFTIWPIAENAYQPPV